MSLSRMEAFAVLGLRFGAPEAEIRSAYKKLALQWHPDKNNNSETATITFQQVTAAYRLLSTQEEQRHMSLEEMLSFFHLMFFGVRDGFACFPPRYVFMGEEFSSDDSDMEYPFDMHRGFPKPNVYPCQNSRRDPYSFGWFNGNASTTTNKGTTTSNTVTVEEANKNAADLIQEEENARKKAEQSKVKKERKKERKRREKAEKTQKKQPEDYTERTKERKQQDKVEKTQKKKPEDYTEMQKERKQQEKVEKTQNKKPEDYTEHALADSSENEDEIEVPAESKAVNKDPIMKPATLTMDSKKGTGVDFVQEITETKDITDENRIPPVFWGTKDNAGTASYSGTNDKSVNVDNYNGRTKQSKVEEASTPASENIGDNSYINGAGKESSDSGDEPEWDKECAFFAKVANSKKQQPKHAKVDKKVKSKEKIVPVKKEKPATVTGVVVQKPSPDELVQRSLAFADEGYQLASAQRYAEATEKFTEAIKLYPQDFRYFGNRSYCFERLGLYKDALMDADVAVNLNPTWPRGHFRKARAFTGLKLYRDAERELGEVLALDTSREDAKLELMNVRTLFLMEMGFSRQEAEAAIWKYQTVDDALNALLRKTGALPKSGVGNIGIQNNTRPNVAVQKNQDSRGALGNTSALLLTPTSLVSLWVGNLTPAVTADMVQAVFIPFGQIHSVKMLVDRKCAFVNYTSMEAAERALNALQGYQIANTNLLIRFQTASAKGTATVRQPQAMPPGPRNEYSKVQNKDSFH